MRLRSIPPIQYLKRKSRRKSSISAGATTLKNQIHVKIEMISSLRKALYAGNIERDKHQIEEIIDDDDLDELNDIMYEYDELLPDEELAHDVIPEQDHIHTQQNQNNDDVICLETGNDLERVRTGVPEWFIDENFSMQYGYTAIVS